jgi:hypothetical protein
MGIRQMDVGDARSRVRQLDGVFDEATIRSAQQIGAIDEPERLQPPSLDLVSMVVARNESETRIGRGVVDVPGDRIYVDLLGRVALGGAECGGERKGREC